MTHKNTQSVREEIQEQVDFIVSISGYGQALHPNDIKHSFDKVLSTQAAAILAELEEKKFEMHVDEYGPLVKKWDGKTYDQPFDDGYAKGKEDAQAIVKKHLL